MRGFLLNTSQIAVLGPMAEIAGVGTGLHQRPVSPLHSLKLFLETDVQQETVFPASADSYPTHTSTYTWDPVVEVWLMDYEWQ